MFQNNVINLPDKIRPKINNALSHYFDGDPETALSELISLAEEGNPEVYVFIAAFYEKGSDNIPINYEKAKIFYEKALNEFYTAESYLALARLHINGNGTEKDYCKAFKYYEKLLENEDNPLAHLNIGKMYQYGLCVPSDYEAAAKHYQLAIDSGYILGLTYLGKLEQSKGMIFKGLLKRLKAGYLAFKISLSNPNDVRLRSGP